MEQIASTSINILLYVFSMQLFSFMTVTTTVFELFNVPIW